MTPQNGPPKDLNKPITNYVLIPLALVQSHLFWLCSAVCWVFKESGIITDDKPNIHIKRSRAHSAPPSTDNATDKQLTKPAQRRASLPEPISCIRSRPTAHDERKGTTCPPVWWQKTRVKLGHAPVHGDPKPVLETKTPLPREYADAPMTRVDTTGSSLSLSKSTKRSKRKLISKLFHRK
ncbi:hypothetical protein RMATCC62417_12684 [Rhizopus microsporus]|nr:hypothetical protein RMATCC62417_12684 [Rhizopus microsporus]